MRGPASLAGRCPEKIVSRTPVTCRNGLTRYVFRRNMTERPITIETTSLLFLTFLAAEIISGVARMLIRPLIFTAGYVAILVLLWETAVPRLRTQLC